MAKKTSKTEGCTCVDKVNEKLKDVGIRLARGFRLNFKTGVSRMGLPQLVTEKTNPTRKKMPIVVCTFCPFCGTKYPE